MSSLVPKDWSSLSIESIGDLYSGLKGKSSSDFGSGQLYITYLQVFSGKPILKGKCGYVLVSQNELQNRVNYGDVLFTSSSETPDDVATSNVFQSKSYTPFLNSFCTGFRIRNRNALIPKFAKYLFRSNDYRSKVNRVSQGSTRYNLTRKYFKQIIVRIPPPINN